MHGAFSFAHFHLFANNRRVRSVKYNFRVNFSDSETAFVCRYCREICDQSEGPDSTGWQFIVPIGEM
jgi:hypothetical protein